MEDPATWHDTVNVLTGVLTALFTGLGAWLVWRQQRERITVEWDFSWTASDSAAPLRLLVRGTLRNGTGATLNAWKLEGDPFVTEIKANSKEAKHESWASNAMPIQCQPAPGASANFSGVATLDWEGLRKRSASPLMQMHVRLSRWLWKSFSIRVHHGASLHFQITIASKSDRRFFRRAAATMQVQPETIEKQIATISKNSSTATS